MFGRPRYALSAATSRIWKFSAVAFTSGLKKYESLTDSLSSLLVYDAWDLSAALLPPLDPN